MERGNGKQPGASFPEGSVPPDFPHSRTYFSLSARGKRGLWPNGLVAATLTSGNPWGLLSVASPKQVSTLALGFQVFSQPAPPHLIAFQSANPWPTPSAPARQATSVWPAVASETSHGPCPIQGQPLKLPLPKPHPPCASHTSNSFLTFPNQAYHGPVQTKSSSLIYSLLSFPPDWLWGEEQLPKTGVVPTVQFPELIVLSRASALIKG